jgi:hypothetical protein
MPATRQQQKGRRDRMSLLPSLPQGTPVDMLTETQRLLRGTAEELILILNALKGGDLTQAKAVGQAVKDLRTAFGWAMDESNNVEKLGKSLAASAAAAGNGYDLDAARDEVGRRLSRLRAAKGDAGISGELK